MCDDGCMIVFLFNVIGFEVIFCDFDEFCEVVVVVFVVEGVVVEVDIDFMLILGDLLVGVLV